MAIAQITMNTSTSRTECVDMTMADFIEFYESLADEAEKRAKAVNKDGQ